MSLKEIQLKSSDYYSIKTNAIKLYIDNPIKDEYNQHIISVVQSFIDYTIANKLVVKDGKVYKNEEEST